jgi:hypothetical protein
MQVSIGFPHMLTSNQRGRGQEPVTVLGRVSFAVAVNMGTSLDVEGQTISWPRGMDWDEAREAEVREAVERLDRLIPREGAHVALGGESGGRTTAGSRLGYLRLGVELLAAALRPLPATDSDPARIEPDLAYLVRSGSRAPFELCEIDEAVGSRPPVRSALGPLGELLSGVLVVAALLVALLAGAVVVKWIFG